MIIHHVFPLILRVHAVSKVNFADICVCVGVGLWVLVIFLEELHAENGQSPKEQ